MVKNETSTAVADTRNEANKDVIGESDLRAISSVDDAFALMDSFGGVESFDDYGTGFEIIDDKDRLVGNPFVVVEWRFTKSKEYGGEFVSMAIVTKSGEKLIVNDGSTGVCAQMRRVTDERVKSGRRAPQTGLMVSRGLRRSDYTYTDDKGNQIAAKTYYLA